MSEQLARLRAQAKAIEPVMNIGKNGITQGTIDLLDRELDQRHLVKIKLNKGATSGESENVDASSKQLRRGIAQELATKTRSTVVEQVGGVIVLWRS
jgi:RNA-binding protein